MPGVFKLEWKDGRFEEIFGHRGYYYVIDGSSLLSFLPEPAWCLDCGQIRLCEPTESVETIRSEIEELDDPDSERSKQVARGLSEDFPKRWRARRARELQIAELRKLAPSCLTCGNRNVIFIPENEWIAHPAGDGKIRLSMSGMCSTDFAMKFYDTEGNPLKLSDTDRQRLLDLVRAGKDE